MDTDKLFKALSDTTRLRCLMLLLDSGELCVCELGHALALPQPKISHHLGALRRAGLVSDRKEGLWVYYRLGAELPSWVIELLRATAAGVADNTPFSDDRSALAELSLRAEAICCN
jgi:ArsR family transcriptional regulator